MNDYSDQAHKDENPIDVELKAAIEALPSSIAFELDAEPIAYVHGVLTVGMAVEDNDKIERLKSATRAKEISVEIRDIGSIRAALHRAYPPEAQEQLSDAVQILNGIIQESVQDHANDIFIEPLNRHGDGTVRIATDGDLHRSKRYAALPKDVYIKLVNMIKNQADVKPNQPGLPGDGRLTISSEGRLNELRVSTMPVGIDGLECVNMRFISSLLVLRDLQDLGMAPKGYRTFLKGVKRRGAYITICGPVGEGKSTTAYAALKELDLESMNVRTVENPIECYIDGVKQHQIAVEEERASKQTQMTFSKALRALLRQYPHFIFIGEIRDKETVRVAMEASTTGISLLSTVHASNAIKVIPRLEALGANRAEIAASMTISMSQRLLRKLCPNCKEPAKEVSKPAYRLGLYFGIDLSSKQVFQARPGGCERCSYLGYADRIGAFEILEFTAPIRDAIETGVGLNELGHIAIEEGFRPMSVAGLEHVAAGETDEEQVKRILSYQDAFDYIRPNTLPPSANFEALFKMGDSVAVKIAEKNDKRDVA